MNAWKAGGSQWSSRLITATLEVGSGQLHILSCYAPTFAATREEKNQFFENLTRLFLPFHLMSVS